MSAAESAPEPADVIYDGPAEERSNRSRGGRGRDEGFRQPPSDREAEQGVLGAMLLSRDAVADVIEVLTNPDEFYHPGHGMIFQTILNLYSEGEAIDAVIVSDRLGRQNQIDRVGGPTYLHTLVQSTPTPANARYYARIVAEKATLRRLVAAGTRIAQLGYDGAEGAEIEGIVDLAQQEVYGVTRQQTTEDYSPISEILESTLDELDEIATQGGLAKGVPTGFTDLDNLTQGLHGGQMIIIAARPGVGKSTLALDFARSAAIGNGYTSAIFSLEMSKTEIATRVLSAETEVKLQDMRAGRMDDLAWEKLATKLDKISSAPLYIDDSPNLTATEIRAKARRLKEQHDLKLIVVDYLQLMTSGHKVESRQQEVSEFSRQLKLLAKELDVPLVAISQLNRGPENRTDRRPQLSDLRESGALEQDADIVMLLYRPDSQDREDERAGEADIILAKHRGGPIDEVTVAHQLHYSRFANLARG